MNSLQDIFLVLKTFSEAMRHPACTRGCQGTPESREKTYLCRSTDEWWNNEADILFAK